MRGIVFSLPLVAAIAACAAPAQRPATRTCADGAAPMTSVQMLFGRTIGTQGEVSEDDWRDFLGATVTPHFPEGLTVLDGGGQFRGSAGTIVRERAKIVLIVVPDASAAMARIDAIAAAYKQRFEQESVGVVLTPTCAAFR